MGASKIIRALPGFMRKSDADILFRGHAVFKDMRGNPAYAKPPVSLYDFAALLEAYTKALGAMIDGGRQATAERNRLRIEVILMLRRFGQYAEIACQNDMTTFLSSGFEPAPSRKSPPQQVPQPFITNIKQGNLGVLLVSFTPLYRKALKYELRVAARNRDDQEGPWTIMDLAKARPATRAEKLTPGTVYVFQVRALGPLGLSDWSPAVSRMCI